MDTSKLKKICLKSYIKGTNNSRLQSLRLPRDLSLGGTKSQQKKVYKPNVNAVRNKNKNEKSRNNEKTKSSHVKERPEQFKQRFIQSTGVFSEGIGPNLNKQKKPEKKLIMKEAKLIKKLDLPDTIKQSMNRFNKYTNTNNHIPTDKSDSDSEEKLPFTPSVWDKNEKLLEMKAETEAYLNKVHIECEYNMDLSNPILTMWQLPDSFACKGQKSCDFYLTDMPDGKIGKIVVRKSGKFEVSIAKTKLKLDSTSETFSEDVVCLNTDTKDCFVLGESKNRYVLSPDWGTLL